LEAKSLHKAPTQVGTLRNVGVLCSNSIFWRHLSTPFEANEATPVPRPNTLNLE